MEGVLMAVSNDSVTSVCTTVESCANLVIFGKNVNELAFAFVAPLGAQNDSKL